MKMLRLAAVLLAGTALIAPASAATLTLSGPVVGNTYGPQSESNPCVIAGTTCQQGKAPELTMSYNLFAPNSDDSYDRYSTNEFDSNGKAGVNVVNGVEGTPYSVLDIFRQTGSTKFDVAIDVNTTSAKSESLSLFEVLLNGGAIYTYTGPTNIGEINNNGNGFADWLLKTVDLSGYKATDLVLFHAVWTGAVGGVESFFLTNFGGGVCIGCTPNPTVVPIPPALAMFAAGIVGLGMITRRRRRDTA